ncbi:MAG: hypothetical protein SGILL_002493, partial [Bacillariaceae sp.]
EEKEEVESKSQASQEIEVEPQEFDGEYEHTQGSHGISQHLEMSPQRNGDEVILTDRETANDDQLEHNQPFTQNSEKFTHNGREQDMRKGSDALLDGRLQDKSDIPEKSEQHSRGKDEFANASKFTQDMCCELQQAPTNSLSQQEEEEEEESHGTTLREGPVDGKLFLPSQQDTFTFETPSSPTQEVTGEHSFSPSKSEKSSSPTLGTENLKKSSSPTKETEHHLQMPASTEGTQQSSISVQEADERAQKHSKLDSITCTAQSPFSQEDNFDGTSLKPQPPSQQKENEDTIDFEGQSPFSELSRKENGAFPRNEDDASNPEPEEGSPTVRDSRVVGSVRLEEASHVIKRIFENTQRQPIQAEATGEKHNRFFYAKTLEEETRLSPTRDGSASPTDGSYESTLPPDSDYQSEDDQIIFPLTDTDYQATCDNEHSFGLKNSPNNESENDYGSKGGEAASALQKSSCGNDGSERNDSDKEGTEQGSGELSPAGFKKSKPDVLEDMQTSTEPSRYRPTVSKGPDFTVTPPRESIDGEVPNVPRKKSRLETTVQDLEGESSDCVEIRPPPFIKKRKKRPFKNSSIVADHVPSNKLQTMSKVFGHQEKTVNLLAKPPGSTGISPKPSVSNKRVRPSTGSKSERLKSGSETNFNPRKRPMVPKTITLTASKKARIDAIDKFL